MKLSSGDPRLPAFSALSSSTPSSYLGETCASALRPLHSPLLPIMAPLWPASYPRTELKYFTPSFPSWKFHSKSWLLITSEAGWKFLGLVYPCLDSLWTSETGNSQVLERCDWFWPFEFRTIWCQGDDWMAFSDLSGLWESVIFQFWNGNSWGNLSLGYHSLTQCIKIIWIH